MRSLVLALGLALCWGAAEVPGQELKLVEDWRVFPDAAARDASPPRNGAVGLLASEVARAGWTVRAEGPASDAPRGALTPRPAGAVFEGARPALVRIDAAPNAVNAWLDGRWELALVSDGRGASVALVPPGTHELHLAPVETGRHLLAWWTVVALMPFLAAALGLLAHRLLARGSQGRGAVPLPSPPRRAHTVLLLVLVGGLWCWVCFVPLLAIDYGIAVLASQQIRGLVPGVPGADTPEGAIMGNSIFFRPLHHTVFGLELLPFGPSPAFLHFMGLCWHLLNTWLVYRILHRLLPHGAFLGALLAGAWPVAGQALTWVTTRQLPMTLSFAAAALLLGARYLRGARAATLAGVAACLYLSGACKESGVALFAVVALCAPLAELAARPWRRILALWATTALVMGLYLGVRAFFGYGFSQGYGGLQFRTPLHMAKESLANLEYVFEATFALTSMDPGTGLPGWIAAVVLGGLTLLAGWRATAVLLVAAIAAALAALPDAIWPRAHWCMPALSRGTYVVVFACWGALGAGAATATRRFAPGLARRIGPIAVGAVILLAPYGHWREATLRREMSEVAARWIDTTARLATAHGLRPDGESGEDLEGPAGLLVVGRPDPVMPEFGPIVGPSVADFIQPPFAPRKWYGTNAHDVTTAESAPFTRSWPWGLVLLAGDGTLDPPRFVRRIGPLRGGLPRRPALAPTGVPGAFAFDLAGVTPREVRFLRFSFGQELPAGTVIALAEEGGTEPLAGTVLGVPRVAGAVIAIDTASITGWIRRDPDAVLLVQLGGPGVGTAAPEVELSATPSALSFEAPDPASPFVEVAPGATLPVLRFRDAARSPSYRLQIVGDDVFGGGVVQHAFPRAVLEVAPDADGEVVSLDPLGLFPPAVTEQWRANVAAAEASHPNFDGFWLLVTVTGELGTPPWTQSRSATIPVKVRF